MVDCASPCLSSSLKFNAFRRFDNGTCELANYVRSKLDKVQKTLKYIKYDFLGELLLAG